jgi:hypothetical protein
MDYMVRDMIGCLVFGGASMIWAEDRRVNGKER